MTKKHAGIIAGIVFSLCVVISSHAGDVRVYDNNNQFLGLFGGIYSSDFYCIFVPEFNGIAKFNEDPSGQAYEIETVSSFYYASDNCTGIFYIENELLFPLIVKYLTDYYKLPGRTQPGSPVEYNSRFSEGGGCTSSSGMCYMCVPPLKIDLPFNEPIALPLRFEYFEPSGVTIRGDVNGDWKVGIEEAVNALQVTSGVK